MKLIGNILWFLLTGLTTALSWLFLGVIWCITIIGIPFGKQCFKLAKLALSPFGKKVHSNFGQHPLANLIWFIFGGEAMAVAYLFVGLVFCITVIGIPFGKQSFKLAVLSAFPFGAKV
jgi:uncharacterized membrane protein YccF (DUF307 family)